MFSYRNADIYSIWDALASSATSQFHIIQSRRAFRRAGARKKADGVDCDNDDDDNDDGDNDDDDDNEDNGDVDDDNEVDDDNLADDDKKWSQSWSWW